MSFSIIVPVHNEAGVVARNAAFLLQGLPDNAEIVFACNGCTDGTQRILERVAGTRALILDLDERSKARAIQAAELHVRAMPRFFVDADVTISGHDIAKLADKLSNEEFELISPQSRYDLSGVSRLARAVHEVAASLPHFRQGAFHCVLGVSAAGRGRCPGLLHA